MAHFYILQNHDPAKTLGTLELIEEKMTATFFDHAAITRDQFFDIFGGAGAGIEKFRVVNGITYIERARIHEFSLNPQPAAPRDEWMPINTAPKDRPILLYFPNSQMFLGAPEVVGRWDKNDHAINPKPYWVPLDYTARSLIQIRRNQPTHWRERVAPPGDVAENKRPRTFVNLNDTVRVKMTEEGHAHLRRNWSNLKRHFPNMGDYQRKPEDSEGYSRWQLNDLMSTFGPVLVPTMQPYFLPDIEVNIE